MLHLSQGVHRIQTLAIRPNPDPCWIVTCRIWPDLDPNRILVTWIRPDPDVIQTSITAEEKNYSFCTTTGKAGMTVYPIL